MSEQERAEGLAVSTNQVGSGAAEGAAREIGATLSAERQRQGLSLDDIAARLKVTRQKLGAIEAGDVSALPDLTFAKGLMRAYARILHADIDPLLARFHAQAAPAVELAARPRGSLNESFDDRNRFATKGSSGGRWVWLALVVVVIGAGALFGLDHARQWLDAQRETLTDTPDETSVAPAPGEPGTVTAMLPPVAPLQETGASEAGAADAQAQAPLVAGLPAPQPASAVAPAAAAASAPVVTAEPAPSAPVAPSAPAAAAQAGAGELHLRFAAETWYEVRDAAGRVVLGGTAKPGEEVAGGGSPPYKVIIGNVKGLASMTRNGAPIDFQAANRNNVARLTLP